MLHELSRAQWRKSRRSGTGENCVELAQVVALMAIRDSKRPAAPPILLRASAWRATAVAIRAGAYDL
ncbi:DUF397 domain-containing protein [Actinomadura flavalba]|nr:DUF397 domain-containing protein [Actinomadura flavalba]